MPRSHTSSFRIEFGDCDPAQIVFYPNFFKWMDIAALHFFNACGIESWRQTKADWGIIGRSKGEDTLQLPSAMYWSLPGADYAAGTNALTTRVR